MMMKNRYTESQEQIALFARAMGHPARMAILEFLSRRDDCYFGNIHEELPIAQSTLSQHLWTLKNAGLIRGEIEAPRVKYCIDRGNWNLARSLFASFFAECRCSDDVCCSQ